MFLSPVSTWTGQGLHRHKRRCCFRPGDRRSCKQTTEGGSGSCFQICIFVLVHFDNLISFLFASPLSQRLPRHRCLFCDTVGTIQCQTNRRQAWGSSHPHTPEQTEVLQEVLAVPRLVALQCPLSLGLLPRNPWAVPPCPSGMSHRDWQCPAASGMLYLSDFPGLGVNPWPPPLLLPPPGALC